jgi:hypothetical protein
MNIESYNIHGADSKMILRPILREACKTHQIPEGVQKKLIENGVKQFAILSDGTVMPTGLYGTVDQFVQKQKTELTSDGSSETSSKEAMLVKMAAHARANNSSAYRKCRKLYSECS